MLKIWLPKEKTCILWDNHHNVIFDWDPNQNMFSYTSKLSESNLVVVLLSTGSINEQLKFLKKSGLKNQNIVFLNIFHSDECLGNVYSLYLYDQLKIADINLNKICFVDVNLNIKNLQEDVIFYDFIFERQKVYFTEYSKYNLKNKVYTRMATQQMFSLSNIEKYKTAKHFLAPMRIYENYRLGPISYHRSHFRKKLKEILPVNKGYISDHEKGIIIKPQEDTDLIRMDFENKNLNFGGGTWYPAHDSYYKDTFVSIYVETITYGQSYRTITEKTFDPMIKGNFILPYGYKNMLKDITNYGFKLPEWIDYSYDEYHDDLRFEKYLDSVKKILDLDQNTLYNYYLRDKHILEHNRSIFFSTPRTSLISLILENFNSRGIKIG